MWHLGTWIPASAGMTRVTQRCAEGRSPFCRGFGGVPQFSFLIPQEWGIQGVENGVVQED
jgi:hypothetical protein